MMKLLTNFEGKSPCTENLHQNSHGFPRCVGTLFSCKLKMMVVQRKQTVEEV